LSNFSTRIDARLVRLRFSRGVVEARVLRAFAILASGRAMPVWRDRGFGMETGPGIPLNRKEVVLAYVVSVLVASIATSIGLFVLFQPDPYTAALYPILAPVIVLVVVAVATATARRAIRTKTK
jgi:hypothetical protein